MDLGTASVILVMRGRGILLQEPSVVAADRQSGRVLQAGEAARETLGRTPGELIAIRPLREGVISDYTIAQAMVERFLKQAVSGRLTKPRLLICVPSGISEVEERAVVDAGLQSGARRVYLMEEPLAAALGAGVDISRPEGRMVVDIGGGTTDVAVIALDAVVTSACLRSAGDSFDEALIRYVRQEHDLLIGQRTAEIVKQTIGQVLPDEDGQERSMEVKGRCLKTGLPRQLTLTARDTQAAFAPVAEQLAGAVESVLERTPPELAADVSAGGILLTGGGSLLRGMDRLLEQRTGIRTVVAQDPQLCVAVGLEMTLPTLSRRQEGVLGLARRRQLRP